MEMTVQRREMRGEAKGERAATKKDDSLAIAYGDHNNPSCEADVQRSSNDLLYSQLMQIVLNSNAGPPMT